VRDEDLPWPTRHHVLLDLFARGLRGQREPDREAGPASRLALHLDLSLVAFDDSIDGRESEPRPFHTLGRKERIEETVSHFRRHSLSGVFDIEEGAVADTLG